MLHASYYYMILSYTCCSLCCLRSFAILMLYCCLFILYVFCFSSLGRIVKMCGFFFSMLKQFVHFNLNYTKAEQNKKKQVYSNGKINDAHFENSIKFVFVFVFSFAFSVSMPRALRKIIDVALENCIKGAVAAN